MTRRDDLRPSVNVRVETIDAMTGAVVRVQELHNLVVLTGRNLIRDAIYGDTISPLSRFAVGTGSTAAVASDTALSNEVWRDVFTSKTKSSAAIDIKYFLTSTTANGNTLSEAALFTTDGTAYARVVLSDPIAKTASVAVLFAWTLSWSAS